jgi:hypothetical protein
MIDLKAIAAAHGCRVTLDESASIPGQAAGDRAWLVQVPGRRAHLFVHSRTELGAWTDRLPAGRRLAALPGARVHQRGDREVTVVLPPEQFAQAAGLIQARRRRVLSDEQRAAGAARLAAFRFAPRTPEAKDGP